MKILLAPMEGVVDPVVRELLTAQGGIDYCVTEFIRITENLYPDRVFYNYCPELHNNSRTSTGTPVFVQLLGGQPEPIAENAAKVCGLGAYGIDLNFGCPAKTVNRHDGGASLLKNPERIFKIASAVRAAIPKEKPLTVKVRLGFSDKSYVTEIAQAAESGNAHWLTVHARTKEEGYRPPAHWEFIAQMKQSVSIPVIANGDIWSPEDHRRCQQVSGCEDTMIGRGIIARPSLAREIRFSEKLPAWKYWRAYLLDFINSSDRFRNSRYAIQRTKQLSKLMARTYPEMQNFFEQIKRRQDLDEIRQVVRVFFASPADA